ncbi:MAG: cytochrome c-type biogenesis protein [Pseudomarimonas sp.]
MSLRKLLMVLLVCTGFVLSLGQALALEPLPFADAAQEQRFRALTAELRCVMCQNQSLADSNAGIAVDLRREIFEMMQAGQSDAEIKTFLTARYGDFVLYNPPLKPGTLLLWFAPFAILLAGAVLIVVMLRRRAVQFAEAQLAQSRLAQPQSTPSQLTQAHVERASHPPVNESREDW